MRNCDPLWYSSRSRCVHYIGEAIGRLYFGWLNSAIVAVDGTDSSPHFLNFDNLNSWSDLLDLWCKRRDCEHDSGVGIFKNVLHSFIWHVYANRAESCVSFQNSNTGTV